MGLVEQEPCIVMFVVSATLYRQVLYECKITYLVALPETHRYRSCPAS
jgi:hypothetical protein